MKKTNAQKQATLRARRAAQGIKQCVIFAHVEHHALIKRFAEQLKNSRQKAD